MTRRRLTRKRSALNPEPNMIHTFCGRRGKGHWNQGLLLRRTPGIVSLRKKTKIKGILQINRHLPATAQCGDLQTIRPAQHLSFPFPPHNSAPTQGQQRTGTSQYSHSDRLNLDPRNRHKKIKNCEYSINRNRVRNIPKQEVKGPVLLRQVIPATGVNTRAQWSFTSFRQTSSSCGLGEGDCASAQ